MDKYIIFHVEGGIGKNIMATAVAEAISKAHPDIKNHWKKKTSNVDC